MKLSHYSRNKVQKVYSVDQDTDICSTYYCKPKGFWVSVDGEWDWPSWCKAEGYALGGFKWQHVVTLKPEANILRISTAKGIDDFTREYTADSTFYPVAKGMNWPKLATQYQGIIISPYIGERRNTFGANWYYVWDCASGCIWDANAIQSIKAERYEL